MNRAKHREVYTGKSLVLPELAMLGTDAPRSAAAWSLSGHVHPQEYEICYIARGNVEWWVGQTVYDIGPGQVFMTRPGEPHGGVDAVLHPCELYWLLLRIPPKAPLPGMSAEQTRTLAHALDHPSPRCFTAPPAVEACFVRLLAECREPDAYTPLAARGILHELLIEILRGRAKCARREQQRVTRQSPAVRAALDWLADHHTETFNIDRLAEQSGLSVTHFHERFRREVGHTPAQWRMRLRLNLAKRLLRDAELTITQIAMRTGFSSSQHFATAFKRQVGMTPGSYRKQLVTG